MSKTSIAVRIRQLRKDLGWSQDELASRGGFSQQQVSKWENGEWLPGSDAIIKLSTTLSVSSDYLLGLADVRQAISDLTDQEREFIALLRRYKAKS